MSDPAVAAAALPVPGTGADRGMTANIIGWVFVGLAMVFVALRFWARILIKSIGKDDWTMLAALLNFIVYNCYSVSYLAHLGGFRHIYDLRMDQTLEIVKLSYISQALVVFTFPLSKASVGFLVLRILGKTPTGRFAWRKWVIYGTIIYVTIISIVNITLTFAQCDPPRALWTPEIPHKCWNPKITANYAIFVGSQMVFADIILAFIPASIILRLNMDFKKRVNLSILLGLGLIAAVCGIIKTTFLGNLADQTDVTWSTYDILNWTSAELMITMVAGSIPPLKPLYDRYFNHKKTFSGYENEATTQSSMPPTASTARSGNSVWGVRKQDADFESLNSVPGDGDIEMNCPRSYEGQGIQKSMSVDVRSERAGEMV